jgi:hypothetical protein
MTFDDSTPTLTPPPMAISPVQRVAGGLLFGALMIAFVAIFVSHHLPTPLAMHISLAVGGIAGAYMAWGARDGGIFSLANPRIARSNRARYLMRHAWLRMPCMALFGFVVAYSAVDDGIFAVITAAIGHPGARTFVVTGTSGGGRSCEAFEVQGVNSLLLDQALCATPEQFAKARPGDRLTALGQVSPFGVNVRDLELAPGP